MDFKKGDIIRGLEHNGYGITNEEMKKAIVLSTWESSSSFSGNDRMTIKILSHVVADHVDSEFDVNNDENEFKKIGEEDYNFMIKRELKNGYILTLRNGEKLIVGDENDELINITPLDDEDDSNECYGFSDFREDLKNIDSYEKDIIKVEKINSNNIVVSLYENATLPTLSISEIEEKFKVKVRNEDKPRFYIGDKVKWNRDKRINYYVFKAKDEDGDYYIARNKEEFEEHDGYYVPEKDLILVDEDEED